MVAAIRVGERDASQCPEEAEHKGSERSHQPVIVNAVFLCAESRCEVALRVRGCIYSEPDRYPLRYGSLLRNFLALFRVASPQEAASFWTSSRR